MDSNFAGFTFSNESTRILALDLAKVDTGYSVIEIPAFRASHDFIQFKEWGHFTTDKRNDKLLLLIGRELEGFITEEIQRIRGQGYNVCLVVEHPVFGRQRSEQQFYLFESALTAAARLGVNVVGIGVNFLKAFVKAQINDPVEVIEGLKIKQKEERAKKDLEPLKEKKKTRFGPTLEKAHIKHFYASYTYPNNPDWPSPEEIDSDDVMDAIYLGAIGAIFCSDVPDLNLTLLRDILASIESIEALEQQLWFQKSYFNNPTCFYSDRQARPFENVHWPEEGLVHMLKAFKTNKHRSLACKMEYPFNQLALASMIWNTIKDLDPEKAQQIRKTDRFKRSNRDDLAFGLGVNYKGLFYQHTPGRKIGYRNEGGETKRLES